ncbi:hypothetical protein [Enorma burkinafasonensis]|uniref:hypothetical protein n=1 Tax=Enorma burkinafasonensis TaxID=2590867 RepID=UPI0011A846FE|nr:hypothetical protein [Enorma burkinafasonensis]
MAVSLRRLGAALLLSLLALAWSPYAWALEGTSGDSGGGTALLAPIDLTSGGDVAGDGWAWTAADRELSLSSCDLAFSGSGFILPPMSSVTVAGDCTLRTGLGEAPAQPGVMAAFDANTAYEEGSTLTFAPAAGGGSLTIASAAVPGEVTRTACYAIYHALGSTEVRGLPLSLSGFGSGICSDAALTLEGVTLTAGASSVGGRSLCAPHQWMLSTSGWLRVVDSDLDIRMADGMAALYATDLTPSEHAGEISIENSRVNIAIEDSADATQGTSGALSVRGTNALYSEGSIGIWNSEVDVTARSLDPRVSVVSGLRSHADIVIARSRVTALAAGGAKAVEVVATGHVTLERDLVRQGSAHVEQAGEFISEHEDADPVGGTVVITPPSADTGVKRVTVAGIEAKAAGAGAFAVELPVGAPVPEASQFEIEAVDPAASVSAPVSANGGATWTFTVTAEDGTEATYSVRVTRAPQEGEGSGPGDEGSSGGGTVPGEPVEDATGDCQAAAERPSTGTLPATGDASTAAVAVLSAVGFCALVARWARRASV